MNWRMRWVLMLQPWQQMICLCAALICKNRRSSMGLHTPQDLFYYPLHRMHALLSRCGVFILCSLLSLTCSFSPGWSFSSYTSLVLPIPTLNPLYYWMCWIKFDVKATEWRENMLKRLQTVMMCDDINNIINMICPFNWESTWLPSDWCHICCISIFP